MLRGLYYTTALFISWLLYSPLVLKWSMKRSGLSFGIFLIPTLKTILEMHACALLHISLSQSSIVQYPFWHVGCNALLRSPVLLAHFLLLHPNCQMTVYLPGVTQPAGWLAHPSFPPVIRTRMCVKAGYGWRWKHSPITESRMQEGMHEINIGRVQTLAFFLKS